MIEQSTVERAFSLARDGSCRTIGDIRAELKRNRYDSVDAHLSGGSIQRQLKLLLAQSQTVG